MEGKDIGYIGLGVAALVVVSKLFGKDKGELAELKAAREFPRLSELFTPNALTAAVHSGRVTASQIAIMQGSGAVARVSMAAVMLKDAAGMMNDREGQAVGAFSTLHNYPELLFFVQHFAEQYHTTPGAFVLDFMTTDGDAPYLAAIVNQVKQLRG